MKLFLFANSTQVFYVFFFQLHQCRSLHTIVTLHKLNLRRDTHPHEHQLIMRFSILAVVPFLIAAVSANYYVDCDDGKGNYEKYNQHIEYKEYS